MTSGSEIENPGRGTTYALPTSPSRASWTPMTADSDTPGMAASARSTSAGYTLKPPQMNMSLSRSVMVR
jgi:hypothetical protein